MPILNLAIIQYYLSNIKNRIFYTCMKITKEDEDNTFTVFNGFFVI